MPADADLLPILLKLKIKDAPWQTTLIGRSEIWPAPTHGRVGRALAQRAGRHVLSARRQQKSRRMRR